MLFWLSKDQHLQSGLKPFLKTLSKATANPKSMNQENSGMTLRTTGKELNFLVLPSNWSVLPLAKNPALDAFQSTWTTLCTSICHKNPNAANVVPPLKDVLFHQETGWKTSSTQVNQLLVAQLFTDGLFQEKITMQQKILQEFQDEWMKEHMHWTSSWTPIRLIRSMTLFLLCQLDAQLLAPKTQAARLLLKVIVSQNLWYKLCLAKGFWITSESESIKNYDSDRWFSIKSLTHSTLSNL